MAAQPFQGGIDALEMIAVQALRVGSCSDVVGFVRGRRHDVDQMAPNRLEVGGVGRRALLGPGERCPVLEAQAAGGHRGEQRGEEDAAAGGAGGRGAGNHGSIVPCRSTATPPRAWEALGIICSFAKSNRELWFITS